jgi:hypothetical protein
MAGAEIMARIETLTLASMPVRTALPGIFMIRSSLARSPFSVL